MIVKAKITPNGMKGWVVKPPAKPTELVLSNYTREQVQVEYEKFCEEFRHAELSENERAIELCGWMLEAGDAGHRLADACPQNDCQSDKDTCTDCVNGNLYKSPDNYEVRGDR